MSFAVSEREKMEREKMTPAIHLMAARAEQMNLRVWNRDLGRLSAGKVAARAIDEQTG